MPAPAPYATYMYPAPGQAPAMYGVPPPLLPHQISHSQSSRYDPTLPPPPHNPYQMSQINSAPVIPTDPRQPAPRPRRFMQDRSATEPVKKPLKSAMKKTGGSASGSGPNGDLRRSRTDGYRGREMKPTASSLSRGHSVSGSERQARATSVSRVRSRSRSRHRFTPGERSELPYLAPESLFVRSFSSPHSLFERVLKVCTNDRKRVRWNIYAPSCRMNLSSVIFQETVDNIRERVMTMWPDGVVLQSYRDELNEYVIQFAGNPWSAKGSLGSIAMKMILELFAVLARQVCKKSFELLIYL